VYVVVLGASGFLGDATSRALAAAGHEVIGISRRSPDDPDKSIHYVTSSYDNQAATAEHYRKADLILHMAWDTTPSASAAQAELEVAANLLPLSRLLDQLQTAFSGRLVFVSTGGALYGDQRSGTSEQQPAADFQHAARETDSANPASYYGAAKAASELVLKAFSNQSGTALTILRPSNIYGPKQSAREQFAVVPTLLNALRTGRSFPMRGDGRAERDYLYIDDFVKFIVSLVDQLPEAEAHNTWNVCFGASTSLNDLIATAESATGMRAQIAHQASPATDIAHVRLSGALAQQRLGWSPSVTLAEGLARTWAWLRDSS
jgi:UDP-glucose 4-epimerase